MIEAINLNKSFFTPRGRIDVLKNLSFSIKAGSFVGITGTSGAGKSTLLSIIAGLQKQDTGSLITTDIEINKLDDKEISEFRNQNIGFISQEQSFLENFTVIDNVRLPAFLGKKKIDDSTAKEITTRAEELLQSLGIAH